MAEETLMQTATSEVTANLAVSSRYDIQEFTVNNILN